MSKKQWIAGIGIVGVAAGITLAAVRPHHPKAVLAEATPAAHFVAGPGRVEPVTEDIKVGSELSGKLREVRVEEGDHVHTGQVVAVLVNADLAAQIETEAAQVQQREAELRKTVNGARDQERREAYSSVQENEAVLEKSR